MIGNVGLLYVTLNILMCVIDWNMCNNCVYMYSNLLLILGNTAV